MTQIVKQDEAFGQFRTMLTQNQAALAAALPQHMNAERMVRLALTCFRQVPKLMECTPRSVMGAIVQAAQLGLEPGNGLGHAYLIPYWNSKKNALECQFMPGYRGYIELAMRSGKVATVVSRVVYENDTFSLAYGTDERVLHVPHTGKGRGKKVGVYCVITMKDGTKLLDFLTEEDVEHAKQSSQSAKSGTGPWKDHEDEMWRKTAVKRAVKYAPLSSEIARAQMLDEQAEVTTQHFDIDLGPEEAEVPGQPPKSLEAAVGVEEPLPFAGQTTDGREPQPQKRRGRPPKALSKEAQEWGAQPKPLPTDEETAAEQAPDLSDL